MVPLLGQVNLSPQQDPPPFGIECEFKYRPDGSRRTSSLYADYEVCGSTLSDYLSPDEITAEELLQKYHNESLRSCPDGVVGIWWFLRGTNGIFEMMPGQCCGEPEDPSRYEDFLTYFTHPVRVDTGESLRWTHLPIREKGWNLTWAISVDSSQRPPAGSRRSCSL